jgi:hypothetical protein
VVIGEEKKPVSRPGSRGRVGADTVTLTIQQGLGNFKWVDAYACDRAGVKKTVFLAGEEVQLYMKMRNDGNASAAARIKVFDDATGEKLWETATMYIDPGASMEIKPPVTGLSLKMPAATWKLRLEITP